jgi:hypothetical protein
MFLELVGISLQKPIHTRTRFAIHSSLVSAHHLMPQRRHRTHQLILLQPILRHFYHRIMPITNLRPIPQSIRVSIRLLRRPHFLNGIEPELYGGLVSIARVEEKVILLRVLCLQCFGRVGGLVVGCVCAAGLRVLMMGGGL